MMQSIGVGAKHLYQNLGYVSRILMQMFRPYLLAMTKNISFVKN